MGFVDGIVGSAASINTCIVARLSEPNQEQCRR